MCLHLFAPGCSEAPAETMFCAIQGFIWETGKARFWRRKLIAGVEKEFSAFLLEFIHTLINS